MGDHLYPYATLPRPFYALDFHESDDSTQVAIPFTVTASYEDVSSVTSPGTALGTGQKINFPADTWDDTIYIVFDVTNDQWIGVSEVRIVPSYCTFFSGVFFHSRVTGACPVTTDLIIMRVNLRTATNKNAENVPRKIHSLRGTLVSSAALHPQSSRSFQYVSSA